jgi:transketolase
MPEVESAAKTLAKKYTVSAYSVAKIKPVNEEAIKKICNANNYIFTIEEHQITGALGSLVAEIIAENSICTFFKRIGLKNQFTQVVGSPTYLRKVYGIDAAGIITTIEKIVKKQK